MAEYERKTSGIRLLRYLVKTKGRTRAAGDKAQISLSVGDLKEVIREYDQLFDATRATVGKKDPTAQ